VSSHDLLAEALWHEALPRDPVANLNVLVTRARRALGDPSAIRAVDGGYALADAVHIDAESFLAEVAAARRSLEGAPRSALDHFAAALTQWRGPPLEEDTDEDWARPYRDRLLITHQECLEEAAALAEHLGDLTSAVALAQAAIGQEPLRENGHLTMARALARRGDHAGALQALDRLRRALADELGLDPSPSVDRLRQDLLHHRLTGADVERPERVTASEWRLPLAGRADVVAAVLDGLAATTSGREALSHLVVAPAGGGKSRLLAEVAARSVVPVAAARAFLPERDDPWSLARSLLHDLVGHRPEAVAQVPRRLLPVLADLVPAIETLAAVPPAPLAVDPQTRRAMVHEGGAGLIEAAGRDGLVVIVDDLQWGDPSSLGMLAAALERRPTLGCVLAGRPDELGDEAVAHFLRGLTVHRTTLTCALPPLSVTDLAAVAAGDLAGWLHEATDGNPFAVSGLVRALVDRSLVEGSGDGACRVRPGKQPAARELISREGALGRRRRIVAALIRCVPAEQELASALALLARPASIGLLAAAAGSPEPDVAIGLSRLAAAGLVRPESAGWVTAHDLVRETLTERLAPEERARLHGLLALALRQGQAEPAELAGHLAGSGDADGAARAWALAARTRSESAAHTEAAELVASALASVRDDGLRRELLQLRAQLSFRRGDLDGARADLGEALRNCPSGSLRSGLLADQAMLFSGSAGMARAGRLAELALVEAGADLRARARALEVAAVIDMNLERPARSRQRAEEALELFGRVGDGHGAVRVMDARAMAVFLDGDIRSAIELFRQVSDLFRDGGNLVRAITPLSTLGHAQVFAGRPAEGLGWTESALDLARGLGHREGQSYALWHRTEALAALGRSDEAHESAREALATAVALGHRGWIATGHRAVGIALAAQGDPAAAAGAFARSLAAAEGLSLFSSWAHARLALALLDLDRPTEAGPHCRAAQAEGPGLARYEADLAEVRHAVLTEALDAAERLGRAVARATRGGHAVVLGHLDELRR